MAKPGPRTQPTIIKELKGGKKTYHRPMPKHEPKPDHPEKLPPAPKHLDTVGQQEWRRISKELYPIGLLTKIDLTALSAYCASYSMWVAAQENIKKHGVLIKAQSGFPMQSPYMSIANRAMVEMRKWLIEFGMTPSSRSRVEVKKPEENKDPLADFLNKGKKLESVKK